MSDEKAMDSGGDVDGTFERAKLVNRLKLEVEIKVGLIYDLIEIRQ